MEFRFAREGDCALILQFISRLADYEKMSDQLVATEEMLKEWIFDKQIAEVLFVLEEGKKVGFALFFHNFSTFLGRAGIYLEDLFVLLCQLAAERDAARLSQCIRELRKGLF